MIVRAVLRAVGSTAALVAIYYLLPLDHSSTWVAATMLVIGLVALIALVAFQVRWIVTSPFPGLRSPGRGQAWSAAAADGRGRRAAQRVGPPPGLRRPTKIATDLCKQRIARPRNIDPLT